MKVDDDPMDLTKKERQDLHPLALFIACWCRVHQHRATEAVPLGLLPQPLCPQCCDLLAYAIARRCACPLHPKPACKHCPIHCYQPEQRAAIRQIMRFSGRHLLLRGRLDLLWHYFF